MKPGAGMPVRSSPSRAPRRASAWSYRSQMAYTLTGDTKVSTLAGQPIDAASGPTKVGITFPDSANLSVAQPSERCARRATRGCELDELEQGRHHLRDECRDWHAARRSCTSASKTRRGSRSASTTSATSSGPSAPAQRGIRAP